MRATSTTKPSLTIDDAVVIGVQWPGDKKENYFAIPRADIAAMRDVMRPRCVSFRLVRDRAYLDTVWIGIREVSIGGVAGWGRCTVAGDLPLGRELYEADVAAQPAYGDGTARKTWEQLGAVERWSWERPQAPAQAAAE